MADNPRKVFFLIYDGVEVLDFTGPFDVFAMTSVATGQTHFEMHTVSPNDRPVTTWHGLVIQAKHSVDNCPNDAIDILVIPGGDPDLVFNFKNKYPGVIDWISNRRSHVKVLSTVCVGALIAAQAGVFDDLEATTHHQFLEQLSVFSHGRAKVIHGARYVDNPGTPNVISSAGVSAGIDMAFHLVGKLLGPEARRNTAKTMEYNETTNWIYA